jgi:hypothetical protein
MTRSDRRKNMSEHKETQQANTLPTASKNRTWDDLRAAAILELEPDIQKFVDKCLDTIKDCMKNDRGLQLETNGVKDLVIEQAILRLKENHDCTATIVHDEKEAGCASNRLQLNPSSNLEPIQA